MRTKDRLRALATAILAASLSFAGPGAMALVSAPDALAQARDGKGDQPFVTRPVSESSRVAVRTGRAAPDAGARDLIATLPPIFFLAPPAPSQGPAPRNAQRSTALVPVTSRSSRGPPVV